MVFPDLCCGIAQYEINACGGGGLFDGAANDDILLPFIRSNGRLGAIWGRLCTRERGHAFVDASSLRRRHNVVRDEG